MRKNTVELPDLPELYQLTDNDYEKGRKALTQAFTKDPIWNRIMEEDREKFIEVFNVPLKYTLHYGKVYAISSELEGIALWLGSPYTNITIFRMIRSRSLLLGMKLGGKIASKIQKVFRIIEQDRRTLMKDPYVYVFVLGIHPDYQGQGNGTKLMNTMLDALPPGIPVYLETETERNVRFYEKLGFEVIKKISVPVFDLPMWELLYKK